MTPGHQNLAAGGWQKLSLCEQLGNIGSEVGRTLRSPKNPADNRSHLAFQRSLELFDLTLADARWKFPALKEVARAREVFCDLYTGTNEYKSTTESLNNYFLHFGILARNS